jgi:Uma2 family endonuclease
MTATPSKKTRKATPGAMRPARIMGIPMPAAEPFEEVLLGLLPAQGEWSEEEYLWLTDRTNRLLEFSDGIVEVLPVPTDEHQRILLYLYRILFAAVELVGGKVQLASLRLRLPTGRFREPDLLLLRDAKDPRRGNRFWTGADLVLEVVSEDDPRRDTVKKRREYARAGIPEYWVVNPLKEQIAVLRLDGTKYVEHGVFKRGATATSTLLPELSIAVSAALDAE